MMKTPNANRSNGSLPAPNGLPNGSDFCKYLIIRKVDGLTGKTPPGDPSLRWSNPGCPAVLPSTERSQTQSNLVKPGQTKSNHPLLSLVHRNQLRTRISHVLPLYFGIWRFSGACFSVLSALLLGTANPAIAQTLLL